MKRNISGVLLLDKPIGLTSNDALQTVKKLLQAVKAGHTGSLDPIASGMLPLCFGEATKFSQFLLEADKTYLVTGKLGEVTASGDSETQVIDKREVKKITEKDFANVLSKFYGKISQIPPMYSAIKYKGQPLYKLVRQGVEVEREPREINIYNLQLLKYEGNLVDFLIHCSKGTYVRTLVADIGEQLGCGAHVVQLRRLTVGPYQANQMVTLELLQELVAKNNWEDINKHLLPIATMLDSIPELILTSDMVHYVLAGNPVFIPNAPNKGRVRLKSKDGRFLGVGEVMLDVKIAPKRVIRN